MTDQIHYWTKRSEAIGTANRMTKDSEEQHRAFHVKGSGWLVENVVKNTFVDSYSWLVPLEVVRAKTQVKLSKSETRIIERVRNANAHGALAGLGTNPDHADFNNQDHRFIKRLYESKAILWIPYTKDLGAGWVLAGTTNVGGNSIPEGSK